MSYENHAALNRTVPNSSKRKEAEDWKDKTILIVEDMPSNYQLLVAYLARTGAKILYAPNGIKALEFSQNNPDIDLILMDLQLPDINGLEVTKEIRKQNKHIPIIAQTAHAMTIDRQRCLQAGCNDYIPKPIRKQDFIAVVGQYIHANLPKSERHLMSYS